jgi:uncharacterized protein (DUF2235 family)
MAVPKIVILSDGTGNAASNVWRTNVWRLFQSLDLRSNEQAAKYDDGVGTWSFLPLAILGGAFGYGLKRNILDAMRGDSRSNGLRMATLERNIRSSPPMYPTLVLTTP